MSTMITRISPIHPSSKTTANKWHLFVSVSLRPLPTLCGYIYICVFLLLVVHNLPIKLQTNGTACGLKIAQTQIHYYTHGILFRLLPNVLFFINCEICFPCSLVNGGRKKSIKLLLPPYFLLYKCESIDKKSPNNPAFHRGKKAQKMKNKKILWNCWPYCVHSGQHRYSSSTLQEYSRGSRWMPHMERWIHWHEIFKTWFESLRCENTENF